MHSQSRIRSTIALPRVALRARTCARTRAIGCLGLLLACLLIGCRTESQDSELVALRSQYVLAQAPENAMTLTEAAQHLDELSEEGAEQADESAEAATVPVVLVGRIYAGDLEPWDSGKAAFLLAELPAEGHGEGHDADNCPFCKRRAAQAPTAIVQFLDSSGEVIPRDARKIFGLESKDIVTVQGHATRGELNTLVVAAEGIYVGSK
jgi:hypothetical protein